MKKIVVLGGTGFVGSRVCEELVEQGWHVTVPTRNRAHARHIAHLSQLTLLELDVHDEAALTRALHGHQAAVNLVAILHGNSATFDRVHVALPQTLARACAAAGVQQVVHISALGVNDQQPDHAPSHYLRSKGRGEAALRHAAQRDKAFSITILRPSVIFGAADKFLNLFANLQRVFPVMPLAGAEAQFQPVWVDDVAQAVVRSLDAPPDRTPRVLEACGPQVYTLKELVQIAARLGGVKGGKGRPVWGLPHWMAQLQALTMEFLPGPTLMSRDNLASMQVANVATPGMPGLEALAIQASALEPVAREYLSRGTKVP